MPVNTLSPEVVLASQEHFNRPSVVDDNDCLSLVDEAKTALDAFLADRSKPGTRQCLVTALLDASAAIARLPKKDVQNPAVPVALDLVRAVSESGVLTLLSEDLGNPFAGKPAPQKQWPGLIARMVVVLPWRAPATPSFSDVPDWLWGDYSAWIFSSPHSFCYPDDPNAFADCVLDKMVELAQWAARNVGSPTVQAALRSYLANFSFLPLTVSNHSLKRHAELHSRILTAGKRFDSAVPAFTGERIGRQLRVAFVASHASAIPEYSRLLDPDRFEISLYALEGAAEANGGEADAASFAILSLMRSGNRTRQFQALAKDLADQLSELQSASLDIVIFTEDFAALDGRLHQLALHRLAPLHVFAGASVSSGLPTADLFVTTTAEVGTADLASQFSERHAIRAGCHLNFPELPAAAASRKDIRARLGLPDGGFVMMMAARAIEITPMLQECCINLLSRLPNAFLAIQLLHASSMPAGAIENIAGEWDQRLEAAGVSSNRLLVLGGAIDSLAHLQSVVVAADVFVDVGAFAEPDLLNVPLALGLPIVTLEGVSFRSRRGAGLLRSMGLDSLIARSGAQFEQIIENLAKQTDGGNSLKEKLRDLTARLPLCRDQLAAAESIGLILEDAYDELHDRGARDFRTGRPIQTPDDAFSVDLTLQDAEAALVGRNYATALDLVRKVFRRYPAHAAARSIVGRVYLSVGQFSRAVDYFLAAVQTSDDAATWFDLAVALYRNDQRPQAVQALETSLRIDASRADAWAMLVELAHEIGARDIAAEALAAFTQLAPMDPRVAVLAQRSAIA